MTKNIEDKKYLTVTEIAQKAGVTRNKAWSFIRKNKIKPKDKNKKPFQFDSKIVFEIKQKQKKKQNKNKAKYDNSGVSDSVLKMFEKELAIKNEQIKEQAETIKYLQSENISMRLQGEKQQKLLDDAQAKIEAVSDDEKVEKKKHWWNFRK